MQLGQLIVLLLLVVAEVDAYKAVRLPLGREEIHTFENGTIVKTRKNYVVTGFDKPIKLLNVPDAFQATDYTCGPACLTAVLNYYHYQYREAELAEKSFTKPQIGSEPELLVNAVNQLGIRAEQIEGMTLEQLIANINEGRPVILLIQAWADDDSTPYLQSFNHGHYVVAIGYDEEHIFYEDPWVFGSNTYTTKKQLLERWHGNSAVPTPHHVYNCAIIIYSPIVETQPLIHMD